MSEADCLLTGGQHMVYGLTIVTLKGETRVEAIARLSADRVKMPCGQEVVSIFNWANVPLEDVLCPCGDPSHVLVRWIDTK